MINKKFSKEEARKEVIKIAQQYWSNISAIYQDYGFSMSAQFDVTLTMMSKSNLIKYKEIMKEIAGTIFKNPEGLEDINDIIRNLYYVLDLPFGQEPIKDIIKEWTPNKDKINKLKVIKLKDIIELRLRFLELKDKKFFN